MSLTRPPHNARQSAMNRRERSTHAHTRKVQARGPETHVTTRTRHRRTRKYTRTSTLLSNARTKPSRPQQHKHSANSTRTHHMPARTHLVRLRRGRQFRTRRVYSRLERRYRIHRRRLRGTQVHNLHLERLLPSNAVGALHGHTHTRGGAGMDPCNTHGHHYVKTQRTQKRTRAYPRLRKLRTPTHHASRCGRPPSARSRRAARRTAPAPRCRLAPARHEDPPRHPTTSRVRRPAQCSLHKTNARAHAHTNPNPHKPTLVHSETRARPHTAQQTHGHTPRQTGTHTRACGSARACSRSSNSSASDSSNARMPALTSACTHPSRGPTHTPRDRSSPPRAATH